MSKRIDAYKKLSPDNQQLYADESTAVLYDQLEGEYGIKDKISFIDTIGDTILGFYHTTDLPQLLQSEVGLTPEQAESVMRDLHDFLAPVREREQAATDTTSTEQTAPEPEQPPANTTPPAPSAEQAEEDIHDVVPMRTMQGDMQRIHGYGAYRDLQPTSDTDEAPSIKSEQTDVLASRPLTDTPKIGR